MHALIKCVEKQTWQQYIDARTEGAVVAEQQRMQTEQTSVRVDPNEDIAFVASLITRSCPNCKLVLADDFSGCLSLKCGRLDGYGGHGCGTEFCAYCNQACQSELDVHEHLKTCVWNPRPGNVFPSSDYKAIVWKYRRERVWFWVMCNAAHKIPSIWDKIERNYSELSLTRDWLTQRAKWLEVASSEFQMSTEDFAEFVPKIMRCMAMLSEMGFDAEHDDDKLFRASLLCKADPQQSLLMLLHN
jgi:hypothetical protein